MSAAVAFFAVGFVRFEVGYCVLKRRDENGQQKCPKGWKG